MTREQDWTTADFVVVDVEGNGAHPADLVELALVPVHRGAVGRARTWLVRPPVPITWQARKVHGISDDDVAHAPPVQEIAEEVLEVLGEAVLVGHAVHLDVAVLARSLPGWVVPDTIDTLRFARGALALPSYSLSSLVGHRGLDAGLPAGMRPHRAGYDATVTARLFVDLAALLPGGTTLDALVRAGGSPRRPTAGQAQPTLFDPLDPFGPLTSP